LSEGDLLMQPRINVRRTGNPLATPTMNTIAANTMASRDM